MNYKNIIGILMLVILFVGIFTSMATAVGSISVVAKVWVISLGLVFWIYVAVKLMYSDNK